MRTCIIIATYNQANALERVLESYLAQDTQGFELILADDGSTDATRRLAEDYAARAPFAVRHLWQENRGFRAATIRNKALAATDAEYVIFSDGDCVAQRDFVTSHNRLAEPGYFLAGNRILLSEPFTARALAERAQLHRWGAGAWIRAWLRGDVNRWLPLVRLPDGDFRKRSPARWEGIKTCNLSAWRADLLRINGMDESYVGWGLEDTDLVIRLLRAGVKHKSARFATPLIHLWHPEADRSGLEENQRRLDEILASNRIAATAGVSQYL